MEFETARVNDFLEIFEQRKKYIAAAEGCLHLELHKAIKDDYCFFTISHWRSDADLQNYRASELFKETWNLTKALFVNKAEAWSISLVSEVIL